MFAIRVADFFWPAINVNILVKVEKFYVFKQIVNFIHIHCRYFQIYVLTEIYF